MVNNQIITQLRAYFANQPVLKAWIFGSVSRGEETTDSDLDIIVYFDPNAHVTLFKHIAMNQELEELTQREVDLVSEGTFYPWIQDSVDKDKILIYERESA